MRSTSCGVKRVQYEILIKFFLSVGRDQGI